MNNTKTDSRLLNQCHALSLNPSKVSTITTTAITSIACPLTILLNALIVIGVAQKKELRTIPTILLASLAATDLLVGVVAEPLFIAAGMLHLQNDYETMCILIITGLFTMHLICSSIYHLTAMAWERYEAITNAIKYKVIVTRGRVTMCAIASWVLTVISIIPNALYLAGFIDKRQSNIMKVCFFSGPMAICLLAIPIFYILIYIETRKRNQIAVAQLLSQNAVNAASERKVAKTTFLLTVALFLSFAPSAAILLLAHVLSVSTEDMFQWAVTLNLLNSLANPILYFYRNRRFRNTVLEMLYMRKPPINPIPRSNLPQVSNNSNQHRHSRTNPSSNLFMETEPETSKAPRPKTTRMYLGDNTMPQREENSSLNEASGPSEISMKEDFGAVGVREDLVTLKKDRKPQAHSYAKKTRSVPVSTREHLFKIRKSPKNQISPNNSMQHSHSRANPSSNLFMETEPEPSKAPRPKTTQMFLDDNTMPQREGNSPLNQTSGLSGMSRAEMSRIRAETVGPVGMQDDLETLARREREPQEHSYAKKTGSVQVTTEHLFNDTGLGAAKFKKPPKNQISPYELPQDSNNATQSNRTQAKPNAWETNFFEENQHASTATTPVTAPFSSDNSDMSTTEVSPPNQARRFLRLRATTIRVQEDINTSLQN